jgi:type I restriction enzyme M protein
MRGLMAIKKSQLYGRLWKSCDELRGSMNPSQYKNYILTLLFVKYVSDKSTLLDIPEGASFQDMVDLKGDKEIGDKINKIIAKLAEANELKGIIDQADFNDDNLLGKGKQMQDTLTKLVGIFETFDFSSNMAGGDDLLGDAYEYLMRNFATASGKSKGQFYTPSEVSRILAKVVGIDENTTQDMTVYDPTCGSGSLLLQAAEEAPNGITIYGQESDQSTYALSTMNMILHQNETAEIWKDNTLSSPYFKNAYGSLKTFDYAVANPPFSVKTWTNGFDPGNDEFGRFEYGMPPPKNGDYAFLLHTLKSLKSRGKAAIILPLGVLFRSNKESFIRKKLISRGFIKAIIGLPANLFYGTGIPACIIVMDKENANLRDSIFFIDGSKGFIKDGNKNRLREQDVHKIVDYYSNQIEEEGYSRSVPFSEIKSESNDYNLNIPRYIDSTDPEDLHDLSAHLKGGIPNFDIDSLGKFWNVFPSLRSALFNDLRQGYSELTAESNAIAGLVSSHSEVNSYTNIIRSKLDGWKTKHRGDLSNLSNSSNVKQTIVKLSESFLSTFENDPLMDKYDAYQKIMEYWVEKMQDDTYLVVADGWKVCNEFRATEKKEDHEFIIKVGKKQVKQVGQVIPASLVIRHYFKDKQNELNIMQSISEQLAQEKEEFVEEYGGDEGALSGLEGGNGKINKGNVQSRVMELRESIMKNFAEYSSEFKQVRKISKSKFGIDTWDKGVIDNDGDFAELDTLYEWLRLNDEEGKARKAAKAKEAELMQKVAEQYTKIAELEGKSILIESKWFAAIERAIDDEVNRIIGKLIIRIKQIGERYASPLSELESEVQEYNSIVERHLRKIGLEW